MRFVFYTNSVSPHQLPLARGMVKNLGEDNYRYIYTSPLSVDRKNLGWEIEEAKWIINEKASPNKCHELLETCDILMSGIRDFSIFERRIVARKKTIYTSERWFKPIPIFDFNYKLQLHLPGWVRLLHPRYFDYARRIAKLLAGDNQFFYYPMGVWAKRDMELICKLFRVPRQLCQSKMHLWGYFVEPSTSSRPRPLTSTSKILRVLWVGRHLRLKRVDAIIRAVALANNQLQPTSSTSTHKSNSIFLDINGFGPEEERLRKLATQLSRSELPRISFHAQVSNTEVRELMRNHDVYVFGSNALDGWGTVVSEALEEGMRVVGTYESGASATILPETNLFHSGDWRALAKILSLEVPRVDIGRWNVKCAVEHLVEAVCH
jgi:glycosyltransferase involved in cell wall biosynthesis